MLTPAQRSMRECASVLVVEDDPTLLSTLAFNLTREGYRVLTAGDGETGLATAHAEADQLDLVLLDVMLPRMSGFDLLRRLRETSDVPVLILSARDEVDDKVDGLELGADDYIAKPFVLRELLARIRATVRRRAVPSLRPPSVLHRGPLQIELERRTVRVHSREVMLRPKEYGLLTVLAMEPGRIFSRSEFEPKNGIIASPVFFKREPLHLIAADYVWPRIMRPTQSTSKRRAVSHIAGRAVIP